LLGPIPKTAPEAFDEFNFFCAPVAAPILSAALHAGFIKPLSKRMDAEDAQVRAALVTAYVLGFAVLRAALGSPPIDAAEPGLIVAKLGAAIQACLNP
jgi:hypothetical protein